jgi:starch-binding outer membrane protein, SusD/RagB family
VPVFDESKHYLWPIPLNVLSQNPNIGQNPGWQ